MAGEASKRMEEEGTYHVDVTYRRMGGEREEGGGGRVPGAPAQDGHEPRHLRAGDGRRREAALGGGGGAEHRAAGGEGGQPGETPFRPPLDPL
eukprot:1317945-Pyramimonas_sp.AAC.1